VEHRDTSGLDVARRYLEIGRPEHALASLSALDAAEAFSAEAARLRVHALLELEDFDRAAEQARHALSDAPGDVELLYVLSVAEECRGRLAAAEAAITSALEQEPEHVELLCRYAAVLMLAGKLGMAERVLADAAAAEPGSVAVLEGRQSLAYLYGRHREAERLSRELLAIDPESVHAQRVLGAVELARGRPHSAATRLGEAVRIDPSDDQYAADARLARRMARNPLWWPNLLVERLTVAGSCAAAIVVIFGSLALGWTTVGIVAIVAWWVLCIWTRVVPPLLRRMAP
jgi:tetratricopeptide (TPR) repeat protein